METIKIDKYAEYRKEWRKNNPEKVKQYQKTYLEKHGDRIRAERTKKYYENKELHQQLHLKYYAEHHEEIKQQKKDYYEKNKELIKTKQILRYYKNKDKKRKEEKQGQILNFVVKIT